GALRERAARPPRPTQLGAPGGRGQCRRGRHRRPRPPGDAAARPPENKGARPPLRVRACALVETLAPPRGDRGNQAVTLTPRGCRGVARAAPTPSRPRTRWRTSSAVLTGRKPRIDSPLPIAKPQ